MRPLPFAYHRAASVEEAIQLLADTEDAKALAGGHSLIPALNLRLAQPSMLVDIGRLEALAGISANGTLSIGALATHAEIAAAPQVQQHCRVLSTTADKIGDPQVRNRGTLGGNLAHADPASDPPIVLLACGALLHLHGPAGQRVVPVHDFFSDLFTTALEAGELVTRIELPSMVNHKTAYAKLAHPASRYAVVGVCVALELAQDMQTCTHASVAVGGSLPTPMKSPAAEAVLCDRPLNAATLEEAASALIDDIRPLVVGDAYAAEDYRTAMAGIYFQRAVRAALET